MLTGNYKKFCKNYELCEGYEKALNSNEPYFLHHIQGEYMSKEELYEYDWYYNCHPSCLKWVTKSEHRKIHNSHMRFETRYKLSKASSENNGMKGKKGPLCSLFGKKLSKEHCNKLSIAKSSHWMSNYGYTRSDLVRLLPLSVMRIRTLDKSNPDKLKDIIKENLGG